MSLATWSRVAQYRFALVASVSAVALPAAAFAQDATATAVQSQEGIAEQDIVVTAQRREERLQDVPIAISSVGSESLAERGIVDAAGLRGVVPGLTISYSVGINASNLVAIRGVSGLASPIGASQATAIYLDGVFLSRPNAAFFALDDVERIEVLRGPQGALYGRNATGGAINIVTRTPGDVLRGGIDASYGNFDTWSLRGSLSGPLGGGFSATMSAGYDRHDGYARNTVSNRPYGDRESYTFRGVLRYATPDEDFSATLAADISQVDQQTAFRNQYTSLAPTATYVGLGNPNAISTDILSVHLAEGLTRSHGLALTLNYAASSALDLTSITAYRKVTALDAYDLDGSALPLIFSISDNSSETFNQEFRGVWSSGAVNLTAGVNFFSEKATYGLAPFGPPSPIFNLVAPFDTSDLKAYAAFGQVEYEIADGLTLVGGLRYNREERNFTIDYSKAPVPGVLARGKVEDDVWIPSAGINWKPSSNLLLYAKFSRGYQAPGFNQQPGAGTAVTQLDTFAPEQLTAYEAGFKSQFLDRRLTFNVAGFWYDYSDLQVRNTIAAGLTEINNAGSARIKGAEATLDIRPFSGFTLSGHVTYVDAKYGSFCEKIAGGAPRNGDPLCADPTFADRSGNRLTLAPEWSGGVSANYTVPVVGAGALSFNASYAWESNSFFSAANETPLSTEGWHRVDARIGFELENGPEIYVYGKNLTDDRYRGSALRASPTWAPAIVSDPRTYGIGVRYRF